MTKAKGNEAPDMSQIPVSKVPRRFKGYVKRGGKVMECLWCGTTGKEAYCTTYCEEQYERYFG